MKLQLPFWIILAALPALFAVAVHAAEETAEGVLFVRLRVKDGAYFVVVVTNVPGVLKARRGP